MRVFILALLVAAFATTAEAKRKPDSPVNPGPAPASFDEFVKLATPAILEGFFDPDSAKITWDRGLGAGRWKVLGTPAVVGWFTCGMVNAKNQYGGYAGARRFVAIYYGGKIVYTQVGVNDGANAVTFGCDGAIKSGILPPGGGRQP